MKKIIAASFTILSVSTCTWAQSFGTFPRKFPWMHIENDYVNVIFPLGLENHAQRVANMVEYMGKNNTESIGNYIQKIDLILQNQTVISNGYVQLAPFKSVFFTTPLQESGALGSLPWVELLAIHEYRHVLQFCNARRGFSLFNSWLFGEFGWVIASNISIPNWFWEGDAVVMESALSPQGRGRLPSFYNGFRALGIKGIIYPYAKVRNGSLKDFVPNHYPLGFLINIYGRETYGTYFWRDVFQKAAQYRYIFYPFSRAIYRTTGKKQNVSKLYKATINYYHQKWRQQLDTTSFTDAVTVPHKSKRKTVTSYTFPQFTNEGDLITLKSSYKKIPTFYRINKYGKEKKITEQGYTTDEYFHYANNKLVWTELQLHPRWGDFDYSNIMLFDLTARKKKRLTGRGKYFSPSFNKEASQIVAVKFSPSHSSRLIILDAHTGTEIDSLPNPHNFFYTYPRFNYGENQIIAAVRNPQGQMALIAQQINAFKIDTLVPFTYHIIGLNTPTENNIWFEASHSGIDNIYRVDLGSKNVYKTTSRTMGNYQPSINTKGDTLLFSEFTHMGNELYYAAMNYENESVFEVQKYANQSLFSSTVVAQEGGSILPNVPSNNYSPKRYNQFANLINFHSWQPYFLRPLYGAMLYSDNVLANFSSQLLGYYNVNEKNVTGDVTFKYGGLTPVFDMGFRGSTPFVIDNQTGTTQSEVSGLAGATLPLNFLNGAYFRGLTLGAQYRAAYVTNRFTSGETQNYYNHFATGRIAFINAKRKALQHLYSHRGAYLALQHSHSLYQTQVYQTQLDYEFPIRGIGVNHNFIAEGGLFINRYNSQYRFANAFFMPKGIMFASPDLYNTNLLYRLGLNYHFPIAYPDFGIAGIVYFLRFRANIFTDILYDRYFGNTERLGVFSYGLEWFFDTRVLNLYSISFGVRTGMLSAPYTPDAKNNRLFIELAVPISRF